LPKKAAIKIKVRSAEILTLSSEAATKPALKRIELPGRNKPKSTADSKKTIVPTIK